MKTIHTLLIATLVYIGLFTITAFAAAAIAPAPAAAMFDTLPWQLSLIPLLTPLIIAGVKILIPKIPANIIPILAPILGLILAIINNLATPETINPWLGATAGLAGVGIREILDQFKKLAGTT